MLENYNRRRAESPDEHERTPENEVALDRLRASIDNFNEVFPLGLAEIYAEFPDELMELQNRARASPMTDDEILSYQKDLDRLHKQKLQRLDANPRRIGWWRRLRMLIDSIS